jgi:hypothetical protein
MKKFSPANIQAFIRSFVVLVTAFGLQLTAEQVAAIQLVVESAIRLAYSKKEV